MLKRALRSCRKELRWFRRAYLLSGDHDSDLLDCLGKFIGLNGLVVVQVEVLEAFHKDSLLGLGSTGLLGELVLELSFKTREKELDTDLYD